MPASQGGTGLIAPGASGNVLTSNGSIWTSAAGGGGGFGNIRSFTTSTTWTIPTGITKIKAYVTGGGAGCSGNVGGGAGGTVVDYLTVTPGATATITIGAGGATGTTSTGGNTTLVIGSTTLTGNGGSQNNSFGSGAGGSASSSGGGATPVIIPGGDGSRIAPGTLPVGAASIWGGQNVGSNAFGSGGGQRTDQFTNTFPNAGAPGVVVIEW